MADELERELVVVNDGPTLLDGPSNVADPEELDASEEAAKRRLVEQARRGAIRESLERMTLFFKTPRPKYLWSGPQVLFFGKSTVLISKLMDCLPHCSSHNVSHVWRRSIRGRVLHPEAPAVGSSYL